MRDLGPLEPLVGEWEGNVGIDISYHNKGDETAETGYFEKAWFRPIPVIENGKQSMHGLKYAMTAWRHGEESMDPFHDEVGYLLWEAGTGQIMRCFAVPRGLAILAGGSATPGSKILRFKATPGSPSYGLAQNKYLLERATCRGFESKFTLNNDGTFSYTSDLLLQLAATGVEMHHTDRNTLHRV
ncbi:MAG: heme-binding beta-barrel domain-containing protein [Blastocatellia bacterium]